MTADEHDDDFGQPLPRDDRLWRHPSEMGAEGDRQQIVLVSRTVGLGRTALVALLAGLVGAAATLGIVVGTGAFTEVREGPKSVEQIVTQPEVTPGQSDLAIAERVLPSIVTVRSEGPAGAVTGTGVVFRSDTAGAHVITTAEATDGATTIEVVTNDGDRLAGRLVGRSVETDVAVVAVDQPSLPVAAGTAERPRFGLHTVIIDAGSPTRAADIGVGFVTVASREVEVDSTRTLYGAVEVTTRANVGARSPGTVVVDESGAVVGLVSGGAERVAAGTAGRPDALESGANAYHLAVPADVVWDVAAQIVDRGEVVHAVTGMRGIALSPEEARAYGVAGGVRLDLPTADSPAETAGLRANDIVIGVESEPIGSMNDLVVAMRAHRPGEQIKVSYLRNGERELVLLTLGGRTELK